MGKGLHDKVKHYVRERYFDSRVPLMMYKVFTSADEFLLETGYIPDAFYSALNSLADTQICWFDVIEIRKDIDDAIWKAWRKFFQDHTRPFTGDKNAPVYRKFKRYLHHEFTLQRQHYRSEMFAMILAKRMKQNRFAEPADLIVKYPNNDTYLNKQGFKIANMTYWVKKYNEDLKNELTRKDKEWEKKRKRIH